MTTEEGLGCSRHRRTAEAFLSQSALTRYMEVTMSLFKYCYPALALIQKQTPTWKLTVKAFCVVVDAVRLRLTLCAGKREGQTKIKDELAS